MKYKVGDKVRVRKDLMDCRGYGKYTFFCDDDFDLRGKIVVINNIDNDSYELNEDDECRVYWTDEMLEPIEKSKKRGVKSYRIVTWDERDGDPFEVFEYKDDAEKFVQELIKREDVIKESIRIYETKAPKQVKITYEIV